MNDDESVESLLAAAYTLDSPDANRSLYARWAETYESGFIAASRYVYHDQVVAVFVGAGLEWLAPADAIVDVGCGTGLAGESLRRHTQVAIDGLDISPEMLAHAAAKEQAGAPVYRRLIQADLTGPLEIETGTYRGAISAGTFTHGHVGPAALSEIVRIVHPGGRAALGINAAHFDAAGFGPALDGLAEDGRITDLELVDLPIYGGDDGDHGGADDADRTARIAAFQVAG